MDRLKSNVWSSETLVRGMRQTAGQPYGLLSMHFDTEDEDLKEQYLVPWSIYRHKH